MSRPFFWSLFTLILIGNRHPRVAGDPAVSMLQLKAGAPARWVPATRG